MLLSEIENKNIILPAYTTMQEIMSSAIMGEEKRLEKIIQKNLSIDIQRSLDLLLKKEDNFYRLTELKQDLRNFNYKQMGIELKKHNEIEKIYQFSKDFLPLLEISQQNIQYYASLATYYTLYKLQRIPKSKAYLYLLCYVYYRHQKVSENIAQAFLYQVDKFRAESITEANDIIAK
jgi:hypothetical protein